MQLYSILTGWWWIRRPQYSIFWNEQGRKYHPELPEFGRLIKGQTLTQIYANYFAGMEEVQREITEDLNKFEKNMLYNYIPGVEGFPERIEGQRGKDSYSHKFK